LSQHVNLARVVANLLSSASLELHSPYGGSIRQSAEKILGRKNISYIKLFLVQLYFCI
jgi:hypothetical protein